MCISALKMSVLLVGIVFCLVLLQTETSVAAETDEESETTSENGGSSKTTRLRGIKATVGPFVTPLRDDNYAKVNDTVALGSRDQWSRSPGFLAHLPILSYNFSRFRWALALSGGLAIGKISTVNDALSIGASPVTVGGSFLFAGPATDSLFAITGGGILKPVERLNGYSIGSAYSGDPKDLTKPVNRWSFFLAVTFSYDIFKDLGLLSTNSPSE